MSERVPDSVIEKAHGFGAAASRNQQDHLYDQEAEDVERRWASGEFMTPSEAAVAAAAPVIARWAREQERERIKAVISEGHPLGEAGPSQSAWRGYPELRARLEGRLEEAKRILAALDREAGDA